MITGVGTAFTQGGPWPIAVSAGTIISELAVSDTVASVTITAPAGPAAIVLTDTVSGATCTVLVRALPILELIRQNLVAAVGQISQANGYFTNPTVQELAQANSDSDNLIIIGLGESTLVKPPVQHVYWRQTFYAVCYCLPADGEVGAAASVDPRLIYLFADVFKAAYVDRQRNQLAYDTVLQPPQFESNVAEAQFRAVVPIHVLYRTLENDPTSLG